MSQFALALVAIVLIGSMARAGHHAARPRQWSWAGAWLGLAIFAAITLVVRS